MDNKVPIYSRWIGCIPPVTLMKALLRAISLGTYAPGARLAYLIQMESLLPHCLCIILRKSKRFWWWGILTCSNRIDDLIHKDPSCFPCLRSLPICHPLSRRSEWVVLFALLKALHAYHAVLGCIVLE
ncbi:hypothetical protein IFM89_018912 [Coptis chinensis]|uniref:Uncharacterized protein n=1 Tax=Coptis chinensis TaxID=261450 RepID=A0A835HCQ5_9MAGN|nr:hypothetical protein IFM89_018912 [Coptis chinensis]